MLKVLRTRRKRLRRILKNSKTFAESPARNTLKLAQYGKKINFIKTIMKFITTKRPMKMEREIVLYGLMAV